jgi:lysophospholipase L1-like esterase
MLETTVVKNKVEISATKSGLTQIFYKGETDEELNAMVIVCSRAGYYDIAFNTWMETLNFVEKGVYFLDARKFGGGNYIGSLTCSTLISGSADESPITYQGNEIQIFSRGLCIGDSITQGVFNHSEGEITIPKYSYPSILKRITGIDIVNAGVAGLTSKTWYEASLDSDAKYGRWVNNEWVWHIAPEVGETDIVSTSLDYSGFDFAVIHLGINDVGMMGDATVEEAIATFETNINNIINKVKTSNNGIKVFLATIIPCYAITGNTVYESFNEKIREIANATENVYLIDLNTYSELFDGTAYENSHLTAIGYHKMASELAAYISYIIKTNLDEFKEIQFIGTDYTID